MDKPLHIRFLHLWLLFSMHHTDAVFGLRKISFHYFITPHQVLIIQLFTLFNQWKNDIGYFKGDNRNALLDSCEAGETLIAGIYEKVLENPVRSEMREFLQNQLRGIQSSLSTVKKIRDLGGTTKTFGNRY